MKKLILLIFLFPLMAMAQEIKNGTIIFDLHPKKKQVDTTTTTPAEPMYPSDEEEEQARHKPGSVVKPKPEPKSATQEDWKKNGLFNLFFHAGMNACQVDGDGYSGYNYLGAEFGVGAMIKVHPILSVSMAFDYSMKGAKETFRNDSTAQLSTTYYVSGQRYQAQFDYLQVPIALNIDAVTKKNKQFMLLNVGLAPGVLVRFKQFDEAGDNVTNAPPEGQPHKFDLSGFVSMYFIIHKNYAIGGKFSYSITRVRGPNLAGITRLLGEYNNDFTIDFMYIMNPPKKGGGRIKGM